ncbi:hypothetical protein AB835_04675 [Candidatus Endobugula sertula]|uniref:Uncharacterized protein n=1 Tax=Candidatus Endobugula sertula TaxID=62101 RepID=A0A1D2QRH9_9GAMM|nr:hypothetical protein AB835_04675 [Candidatus Endobugula sertula]
MSTNLSFLLFFVGLLFLFLDLYANKRWQFLGFTLPITPWWQRLKKVGWTLIVIVVANFVFLFAVAGYALSKL